MFPSLNCCGADEHIPAVEQYIQTIKDHTRTTYQVLPFHHIPHLMLIHLMKTAVLWLNAFPQYDGVSSEHSPHYHLTRYELAYDTHAVLEFSAYIQTNEKHSNDMTHWTLGAICLGPTGNHQGGHWFMTLSSGFQITRH